MNITPDVEERLWAAAGVSRLSDIAGFPLRLVSPSGNLRSCVPRALVPGLGNCRTREYGERRQVARDVVREGRRATTPLNANVRWPAGSPEEADVC